jgi:hypothetical protein
MHDTERVLDTQAKLALIAERARREPQCRFTSLAHLLNERFLLRLLQIRIQDRNFLLLIWRFLKARYPEAGQYMKTEEGTPQGGNLSPILSNIFLHYQEAVVRMVRKWLNRRSQRRIYYWKRFQVYLTRFPLPTPRITHNMFTLSPVR